jgi:hypothetical protein
MYAFLSRSNCQSRILIHGNYGNHKESSILVELHGRSKKGEAFKSRTTIFLLLKLPPDNADVSLFLGGLTLLERNLVEKGKGANPESGRMESGRKESSRMSNSANPESGRMESGRMSNSANPESGRMEYSRMESGRISN